MNLYNAQIRAILALSRWTCPSGFNNGETQMTAFNHVFDTTVAVAFVALSLMLAGATAILGA